MTKVQLPHEVGVQFDEALAVSHNDFDITMLRVIDASDENRLPALSEWWYKADNPNATKKLLNAYENGWEDEVALYYVPVPHTHKQAYYTHIDNGIKVPLGVTNQYDLREDAVFTMDQINHYGLSDLPRYEVNNAQ